MGKSNSKPQSEDVLFCWQRLTIPKNDNIKFDPRYDAIKFNHNNLFITDSNQRIFEWELDTNDSKQNESNSYNLKSIHKYKFENPVNKVFPPLKKLDNTGSFLVWIDGETIFHCFDLKLSKLHSFDIKQWLTDKYSATSTNHQTKTRCIVNNGNGSVIFLVTHTTITDNMRRIDIVEMDIINKKELKTVTIKSNLMNDKNVSLICWGFLLNQCDHNTESFATVMFENSCANLSIVLFVSLSNGNIIWQSQFDRIYDAAFNTNGKYLCIFEKPKSSLYGYIHILNVTRLEWICQIRLTYDGILPALGWDAFTWLNNNLIFVAPNDINISTRNDLNERVLNRKNSNDNVEGKKRIFTAPLDMNEYIKAKANKKICILSLDKKYYDVETDIIQCLKEIFNDNNICQLILEYGGFNWAIVNFPYPCLNENRKKSLYTMSEVFMSGSCGTYNVLLMASNVKDIKDFNVNQWFFDVCIVPKTFNEMWNHQMIQKSVIGNIM